MVTELEEKVVYIFINKNKLGKRRWVESYCISYHPFYLWVSMSCSIIVRDFGFSCMTIRIGSSSLQGISK